MRNRLIHNVTFCLKKHAATLEKVVIYWKLEIGNWKLETKLTKEIAVVIFVPPEAPITKRATPSLSKNIDGAVEDWGRFPG